MIMIDFLTEILLRLYTYEADAADCCTFTRAEQAQLPWVIDIYKRRLQLCVLLLLPLSGIHMLDFSR